MLKQRLTSIPFHVAALLFCLLGSVQIVRADSYTYTIFASPISVAGFNDSDQIVGTTSSKGVTQSFLYSNGVYTSLQGTVDGINNNGVAVGYLPPTSSPTVTNYTYSNGAYSYFSVPSFGNPSFPGYARAINNTEVVGDNRIENGFTYNGSTLNSYGVVGLSYSANGVNDAGVIVGSVGYEDAAYATLYSNGSLSTVTYYNPAVYNGFYQTEFFGINNSGQILGYTSYPNPGNPSQYNSFYFTYSNRNFTNLDLPSGYMPDAINDQGQIAGNIIGANEIFIATPVPEIDANSGASALALLAGVLLIVRGRRAQA